MSSDDDSDWTQLYGKYDSQHAPDVDMRMKDDADVLAGVDLQGNVDMERAGDDTEPEDEEEEDE